MADGPKGAIERYVFHGFATIIGLSLSLNSFFVKDKIQDISTNIAKMASSIHGLEVSTALTKQQLDYQSREIMSLKAEVDQLKRQVKGR